MTILFSRTTARIAKVSKNKEVEMLEGLVDRLNVMVDELHGKLHIAQAGILHIAKNTMQDHKWENADLHKYSYALDKKILKEGPKLYAGWGGQIKKTNLENMRKTRRPRPAPP